MAEPRKTDKSLSHTEEGGEPFNKRGGAEVIPQQVSKDEGGFDPSESAAGAQTNDED